MKKIYYLFALFVCSAMLFVACEPKTPSDDDSTIVPDVNDSTVINDTCYATIKLVEAHDAYYSTQFVEGVTNDYWMSFTTEDVVMVENNPMGTGEFVYLEVFPKTVENNFPVGNYPIAEEPEDGYAWAGWEWDMGPDLGLEEGLFIIPQGCFAYVLEDDELVDTKYILSGYIDIKGTPAEAEVFVDATFNDGTKSTYYYKGALNFTDYDAGSGDGGDGEDLNWDYEPTEKGDYTATFDYCEIGNWGDYYGDGIDFVDVVLSGLEWGAMFNVCAPLNSAENIYGTYTVKSDYSEWSVVPSPGGDMNYDYASFLSTGFEEDLYTIAYYVASGTVVIAEDGITFDVVSHYGSKIKGEYKGDVVAIDKSTQYAPSKSPSKGKPIKLVKATVEDLVYFGALKNRVHR